MLMPSIIFESNDSEFAIPSNNVQAIIHLPAVTEIPDSPPKVRGIIKHRDLVYTVIDFRILTGEKSLIGELSSFKAMLFQREKDHINWLNELENSVKENRPFSLAVDPHKCAFGRWYDNFKSANNTIRKILFRFEEPHKKIHEIASQIEHFKKENQIERAIERIEETRNNELKILKSLFSQLRNNATLEFKESAILLNLNSKLIALAVDCIKSVEDIEKREIQDFSFFDFKNNFITGLGKSKDKNIIITVSEEMF